MPEAPPPGHPHPPRAAGDRTPPEVGPRRDDGPAVPEGFDEADFAPFPRRRRSPAVRWVALVVAVALVVFIVGTTIGVLGFGGSPGPALHVGPVRVVALGPAGQVATDGTADEARTVFTIENTTGSAVDPVCTVEVQAAGATVGSVTVHGSSSLGPGRSETAQVTVPFLHPAEGDALGQAQVSCAG